MTYFEKYTELISMAEVLAASVEGDRKNEYCAFVEELVDLRSRLSPIQARALYE